MVTDKREELRDRIIMHRDFCDMIILRLRD